MSRTDELNVEQVKKEVPGGEADKPTEIPPKGWFQIVKRGWAEAKADQVPLLAAGVAFFAFLALFPAMIALVLLYGLVADPAADRRPGRRSCTAACRRCPRSCSPTSSTLATTQRDRRRHRRDLAIAARACGAPPAAWAT